MAGRASRPVNRRLLGPKTVFPSGPLCKSTCSVIDEPAVLGGHVTNKTEVLDGSELERIRSLMADVVDKSSKGKDACVYRGEPACYPIVSSGLFRACPDSANEAFDIVRVEEEMVADARRYTTLVGDEEILTEIQHFGGVTNLIDFTDDYLIALFFASVENEQTDGRVVLHWPEPESVLRPKHTMNRIVSQRSVFVRPRRGFIVPDTSQETVLVPCDLKGSILTFLERFHGISKTTVYNDIHGFIRHQTPSRSRYARTFRESLSRPRPDMVHSLVRYLNGQRVSAHLERIRHAYHQRGMMYKDSEGSLFIFRNPDHPDLPEDFYCDLNAEEIVDLFTHLIENKQDPIQIGEAYCRRGEAYLHQGAVDLAIRDFAEALDRDPEMPEAYHGRGNACRDQGKVDRAMADLEEAIRLKPELVAPLVDRGNMHRESGSLDRAIEDLDTVIAHMRVRDSGIGDGDGHFYRAVARCAWQDWGEAKSDFEAARQKGVLVASSFCAIFGGVPDFEARYGVRIPSDLATILHAI